MYKSTILTELNSNKISIIPIPFIIIILLAYKVLPYKDIQGYK